MSRTPTRAHVLDLPRLLLSLLGAGGISGILASPPDGSVSAHSGAGTEGRPGALLWEAPVVVMSEPARLPRGQFCAPELVIADDEIAHVFWCSPRDRQEPAAGSGRITGPARAEVDHLIRQLGGQVQPGTSGEPTPPSGREERSARHHSQVRHLVRNEGQWRELPPLGGSLGEVPALRAARAADHSVFLLWGETGVVDGHRWTGRIFFSACTASGCAAPEPVSEPESQAITSRREDLDLSPAGDGSIDIFWTDWHEQHFVPPKFTGYPKTYHRRRVDGVWKETRRIQDRGKFYVNGIRSVRDGQGTLHLIWREDKGMVFSGSGRSDLYHARFDLSSRVRPERITRNRSVDGSAGLVTSFDAGVGADGTVVVAWTWRKMETGGDYVDRVDFKTLTRGAWRDAQIVSRQAEEVLVRADAKGRVCLLFQHHPGAGDGARGESGGSSLVLLRLGSGQEVVAEGVLDGLFDVELDARGSVHLVYAVEQPSGAIELLYRRGSRQAR